MRGLNITLKQYKQAKKRVMELAIKNQSNSIVFKITDTKFEFM